MARRDVSNLKWSPFSVLAHFAWRRKVAWNEWNFGVAEKSRRG